MARELTEKNALLSDAFGRLQTVHDSLDRDLREARKLQQSLVRERVRDLGAAEIALPVPAERPCGRRPRRTLPRERHAIRCLRHRRVGPRRRLGADDGAACGIPHRHLAAPERGADRGRRRAFRMRPPDEVCTILNNLLLEEMETDLYFTMALAIVDLATGAVRCVQAGHPRPLVQTRGGRGRVPGRRRPADRPDPRRDVGRGRDPARPRRPALLLLRRPDRVRTDADGRMLEEDGLADLLRRHRGRAGAELLEALVEDLDRRSSRPAAGRRRVGRVPELLRGDLTPRRRRRAAGRARRSRASPSFASSSTASEAGTIRAT